MMRVVISLARRELVRFLRQRHRVVGTIMQPLMFWLFLGVGFSGSFRMPGTDDVSYLEYFYPGIMMMMMLFASIFSSITVIEDRDQGFLQSVLVAPVPHVAIALGKVLGGAAIAMIQVLILTLAAPLLGLTPGIAGLALLVLTFALASIGFAALGFLLAWGMQSTSGFHAIMMVFLMPLWMASGALFPIEGAPGWLAALMQLNPIYHALVAVRGPFYSAPAELFADGGYLLSLGVVVAWAAICLALLSLRVRKRERGAALMAA